MESEPQAVGTPKWMIVVGWIISVLPALALIASGVFKFIMTKPPEGAPDLGWSQSAFLGLGIIEVAGALMFLCPRTAVLGAIVLTGYLGGAVATHLRIGDPFFFPIIFGTLIWFGLLLRDERVRAMIPWRRDPRDEGAGGFLAGAAKVLLTFATLIGIFLALVAAQPAEFRITRSTTIDAPPAKVFEHVNDLRKWEAWSPWAKLDPNVKNTFEGPSAGKGSVFKWAGNEKVGEGILTITESQPSERVKLKLEFIKPFPDTADTEFTFKANGNQTVVTWTMTGERPFFNKLVCSIMSMETLVGGSFNEGLANIKKIAEDKK